ncbi:alpha/beta fold hydrolase [Tsukamurella soli]|uniref:Alpha/beta hydrolase n=1 Tax=Tsukamurella soli TaxID=644556 RepID=A0ABP8JAU0_9ACTN
MTQLWSDTLEVRRATLSFDVREGHGPTVVALHGLGSSRANDVASGIFDWSPAIGHGRRLVRYDARGHGDSAVKHPAPDDFTWPRLAEDLLDLLDVVSPEERVDAVGVSMGVGTLLHAAVRAPERFRCLALVLPPTAWATRVAQREMYLQMAGLVETRGAAALAALMTIHQPVLLRPWINDPAHPISTAERLADLLPSAGIDTVATAAQVRALTGEVATFFETHESEE